MTTPNTPPAGPTPYVRETLELLGDKDPLVVLEETPLWIAARIKGFSDEALATPEGPGKWSLQLVLAHLADAEVAFSWRARIVLTQENAPLQGYDEHAWLMKFDYAHADAREAYTTFATLRHWNMRVWRSATAADLDRMAIHSERGPESFRTVRAMTAGHDLRHRRQIERLLKIVG